MKAVTKESKKHKLDCNEIQLATKGIKNNDRFQVDFNFQSSDDFSQIEGWVIRKTYNQNARIITL